jgi:hypothetical protein
MLCTQQQPSASESTDDSTSSTTSSNQQQKAWWLIRGTDVARGLKPIWSRYCCINRYANPTACVSIIGTAVTANSSASTTATTASVTAGSIPNESSVSV